jgi:hypothetical protein
VEHYLERGDDLARSLSDTQSLIVHFDIDYVNFDFPSEPYLDPLRTFRLQEPVVRATLRLLGDCGIRPLQIMTGRGYHFVWRVSRYSEVVSALAGVGRLTPELEARYVHDAATGPHDVGLLFGRASAGLALVMEYLAHLVRDRSGPSCNVPVEITAVEVGPVDRGREMIALDTTEHGDPLSTRFVRVPYSIYRKHDADAIWKGAPPAIVAIPLGGARSVEDAVGVARTPAMAARLAEEQPAEIPEQSAGTCTLLERYRSSDLARFHDWFYLEEQHPPQSWPQTYDRTRLGQLPPCVADILARPNNALLKPAGIALVTRALLALGWHPRHVAGLIRSKYERDFGWGNEWYLYDASTRADFYTRTFAGLLAVSRDDAADFDCESIRSKGLCSRSQDCALRTYRQSLIQRRDHGKLGHSPFDRLLL